MRTETVAHGGVRVRAIAGTHTVLLAFDVTDPALRQQLLGFAIRRSGPTEAYEPFWFEGTKVFKSVVPNPGNTARYSTLRHPIQSLLWGDYTPKPGRTYEYLIRTMVGDPADPQPGPDVTLTVKTERERNGKEGVWFNRGAIASQVFAGRYGNRAPKNPDDPKDETTKWLSRGLLEACLAFIADAKEGDGLLVAAYEFTYKPVLDALKAALDRGVKVRIVYDHSSEKAKDGTSKLTAIAQDNQSAVRDWRFPKGTLFPRDHCGDIPHNKFIVRLDGEGTPISVWTGSTNFSASGFLGQSNVGHLVVDATVAAGYAAYWKLLKRDLDRDTLRPKLEAMSAFDDQLGTHAVNPPIGKGVSTVFSPRASSKMLDWYAARVSSAVNGVMWTGAFGVDPKIAKAVSGTASHPRFLLLEKPPSKKTRAIFAGSRNLQTVYGNVLGQEYVEDRNGELTVRRKIPEFELEQWYLEEELFRKKNEGHIFFVHTKFLLVDPLSDDPMVFSGSANFSSNSLLNNDENMLLIRGNRRVADIYLTEFDRLLRHFLFRDVAAEQHRGGDPERGKFLYEKPEQWVPLQYSGFKETRRRMFFPV